MLITCIGGPNNGEKHSIFDCPSIRYRLVLSKVEGICIAVFVFDDFDDDPASAISDAWEDDEILPVYNSNAGVSMMETLEYWTDDTYYRSDERTLGDAIKDIRALKRFIDEILEERRQHLDVIFELLEKHDTDIDTPN